MTVIIISYMLCGVSYWLPEYTKAAFPGQVFLPQRTYTTPPEDGPEDEGSEIKCGEKNVAHIMRTC